jgi:hypothetical protein
VLPNTNPVLDAAGNDVKDEEVDVEPKVEDDPVPPNMNPDDEIVPEVPTALLLSLELEALFEGA